MQKLIKINGKKRGIFGTTHCGFFLWEWQLTVSFKTKKNRGNKHGDITQIDMDDLEKFVTERGAVRIRTKKSI